MILQFFLLNWQVVSEPTSRHSFFFFEPIGEEKQVAEKHHFKACLPFNRKVSFFNYVPVAYYGGLYGDFRKFFPELLAFSEIRTAPP
jgi:hypothetical protein